MTISQVIENTIGREGAYVNHPNDKGGPTRWGITQRIAVKHGYTGDMKTLPRETAKGIYYDEFMVEPGFDKILAISPAIAEELFDSGVNFGTYWPRLWLQIALNAFNNEAKLYPDIREDGDLGPGTLGAFRAYMKTRGLQAEKTMVKALDCQQGARYLEISRNRKANEAFTFGWFVNRVGG